MVGRGYTSKRHDFEIASSPASREKVDLTKLQTSPGKKEFKFSCEDREREREREKGDENVPTYEYPRSIWS